jgi:hypothetical protein
MFPSSIAFLTFAFISVCLTGLGLAQSEPLPTHLDMIPTDFDRVVVVGDLHGDLNQALRGFLVAGIISLQPNYYTDYLAETAGEDKKKKELGGDGHPVSHKAVKKNYLNFNMMFNKRATLMLGSDPDTYHWAGGKTLVVCTGDAMNIGPDDFSILRFVMRLSREARATGGRFEFLLGNHEMRNLGGDFDGVHPWSYEQSGGREGRTYLLSMKSDVGAFLRRRRVMFLWNGWLFLHGGLVPTGLAAIKELIVPFNPTTFVSKVNDAVLAYLTAKDPQALPRDVKKLAEIFTNVNYTENGNVNPMLIHPLLELCDSDCQPRCTEIHQVIADLGGAVKAQIVGHTPHFLPNFAFCDGELIAIDFGNSKWKTGKGAAVATLVLTSPPQYKYAAEISKRDGTKLYSNKLTLGDWDAALAVATADQIPTQEELESAQFWYRAVIGFLLLMAIGLSLQLWRRSKQIGQMERAEHEMAPLRNGGQPAHPSYGSNA